MPELLYLSRADVAVVGLPMAEIIEAVDAMFRLKGQGKVEMPPKPGIHPLPDAFIHAMPAFLPDLGAAGIKWVSGYPQNHKKNLPYINGLLILNDPETGLPLSVMDCTWITAMRTGAATAVAAKYLARPESNTVGILAAGVQGRSNLEALAVRFKLTEAKVYDVHAETARRFTEEMGQRLNINIKTVATPKEAVVGLDLVVTSGPILKDPSPVIEADWLSKGAFASPVDFDSYWQKGALAQADKLATDDVAQMSYYRKEGYFRSTPEPYADLGAIAAGKKPGRESPDERTISINLGLAAEDMATAILIYKAAVKKGLGTKLPL